MFLLVASARQYLAPRRMARIRQTVRDYRLQLRGVHRGMLGGIVPEPCEPHGHPHEPNPAEQDEDCAPRQKLEAPEHQYRRQAADQVRTREEDSLDRSALAPGDPAGKRPRDAGPGAGFPRAEQKADGEQDGIAEGGACRRREARPPDHDARQHGPRALPVCPPRGRNLEERIRQLKDGKDVAHLDGRQPQVAHDSGRQGRDARAIQVGDHRKGRGQGHDTVPRVSGGSHCGALYATSGALAPAVGANDLGAGGSGGCALVGVRALSRRAAPRADPCAPPFGPASMPRVPQPSPGDLRPPRRSRDPAAIRRTRNRPARARA